MFVVALGLGIVAAGILDVLNNTLRRHRSPGLGTVVILVGAGIAVGGWYLVKSIDDELDVAYFIGFIPTLLAGDYLSKKVSAALARRGVRR